MSKFLVLASLVMLFGCSVLKTETEVVEVPDEVWQRVKKQADERFKADQASKKNLESQDLDKLNKALEQIKKPERKR